jgi:hypothetical protein
VLCLGFDYYISPIWLAVALAFGLAVGWVSRWAFDPRLAFSVTWLAVVWDL